MTVERSQYRVRASTAESQAYAWSFNSDGDDGAINVDDADSDGDAINVDDAADVIDIADSDDEAD